MAHVSSTRRSLVGQRHTFVFARGVRRQRLNDIEAFSSAVNMNGSITVNVMMWLCMQSVDYDCPLVAWPDMIWLKGTAVWLAWIVATRLVRKPRRLQIFSWLFRRYSSLWSPQTMNNIIYMINLSSEHNHLKIPPKGPTGDQWSYSRCIYIILPQNYEGTEDARHYGL
jgi:hypothetical protein